jgi:hypothetical protein
LKVDKQDIARGVVVYETLEGQFMIGASDDLMEDKKRIYKLLTGALDVVMLDILQDQLYNKSKSTH